MVSARGARHPLFAIYGWGLSYSAAVYEESLKAKNLYRWWHCRTLTFCHLPSTSFLAYSEDIGPSRLWSHHFAEPLWTQYGQDRFWMALVPVHTIPAEIFTSLSKLFSQNPGNCQWHVEQVHDPNPTSYPIPHFFAPCVQVVWCGCRLLFEVAFTPDIGWWASWLFDTKVEYHLHSAELSIGQSRLWSLDRDDLIALFIGLQYQWQWWYLQPNWTNPESGSGMFLLRPVWWCDVAQRSFQDTYSASGSCRHSEGCYILI